MRQGDDNRGLRRFGTDPLNMSQNTPVPESDQLQQAAASPGKLAASDPPAAEPTPSTLPAVVPLVEDAAGATEPAVPAALVEAAEAFEAAENTSPAHAADAAEPVQAVQAVQAVEAADVAEAAQATPTAAAAEPAPKAPAIPDLSPAACAALLAERFPALFGVGRALPIKLRIQADIQERAPGVFNKKSLSIFLHRHTTSTAYIKALVNSPQRIDLDGQPAGDMAQEHKDAGVVELQRRQAIVQARRVAEREAQRTPRRGPAGAATDAGAPAVAEGEAAAVAAAPLADARPPRPPRPPRADRPPRGDRPAQARPNDRGPRPPRAEPGDRPARPARPDVPGQGDRAPRPSGPSAEARGPRPERAQRPDRSHRPEPAGARPFAERGAPTDTLAAAPAVALTPEQAADNEARRGRAALLRAFESTTLTAANFCALKGLKVDALHAALEQARQERGPVVTVPAAAPRTNPGFAPRPGGRRP